MSCLRDMNRRKPLLAYQQIHPIRLECAIDLGRLFGAKEERARFDKRWLPFLQSDPYKKKIFKLRGDQLFYSSEHLIPKKKDNRPPLLLVFGNPASHSVAAGMFFAFKGKLKKGKRRRYVVSGNFTQMVPTGGGFF